MNEAKRILLIDDDAAFRTVLARALRRHGHRVCEAWSAAEALVQAQEFRPEWVLLDLKLGQDNGLTLVEPLSVAVPNVRIVVATGYASIPTTVDAMRRGAWNYLAKPFDLKLLLRAFENDSDGAVPDIDSNPMALHRLAWEHIQRVMSDCHGNISEAARRLGVDRRTLQRRLAKRAGAERP